MKKHLAILFASVHTGTVMLAGLVFALYLFIGPFDATTYIKLIFRFNNNIFNAYGVLVLAIAICSVFMLFYFKTLAARVSNELSFFQMHKGLMKAFFEAGHKQQTFSLKTYLKKAILILIFAWFLDLFHEGFVATPALLYAVIWYLIMRKHTA